MADKTISVVELLEMAKDGAKIKTEQKHTVIDQFDELIKKLQGMIEAQQARATADLARSQTQLEVMGVLQMMIKKQGGVTKSPPIDLEPLQTVLSQIVEANEHKAYLAYDFAITRNSHGIESVRATPISPTLQ